MGLEGSVLNVSCTIKVVSRVEVIKEVWSEAVLSHVRSQCSVLACVCVAYEVDRPLQMTAVQCDLNCVFIHRVS